MSQVYVRCPLTLRDIELLVNCLKEDIRTNREHPDTHGKMFTSRDKSILIGNLLGSYMMAIEDTSFKVEDDT